MYNELLSLAVGIP